MMASCDLLNPLSYGTCATDAQKAIQAQATSFYQSGVNLLQNSYDNFSKPFVQISSNLSDAAAAIPQAANNLGAAANSLVDSIGSNVQKAEDKSIIGIVLIAAAVILLVYLLTDAAKTTTRIRLAGSGTASTADLAKAASVAAMLGV